jgi:DNA ligase-associated metallophosphoesterase
MVPFSFADQEFVLTQGRALYWPREAALVVADLHLEKASFFARHGQMLPPYDSRETLERIALAVRATGARRVFCLGDNFHDAHGPERLEPYAAGMLAALTRALDWLWIAGNHDVAHREQPSLFGATLEPLPRASHIGGTAVDELEVSGIVLRHHARPGEPRPELSGHFHPKLALNARGRRIARPCAVTSGRRAILPAFGALTGGMNAGDPAILAALQPATAIDALVAAGDRLVQYPLWRAAA